MAGRADALDVRIARDQEIPLRAGSTWHPATATCSLAGRHPAGERPLSAGQRPSATLLFQSLAKSAGPRGLGVILTGMGEDGAQGLVELRQAGGYTVAEDESTAVVYGMPAAACEWEACAWSHRSI